MYATKQPPDLKRARQWYRRAALKGHIEACSSTASCSFRAKVAPKKPAQGRRYLERAAVLGEVDALKVLAHALSNGEYAYRRSPSRAKKVNAALRRALARLQKDTAG